MDTSGSIIYRILELTAWRMDPPAMFSAVQISATVLTAAAAVLCARLSARILRTISPDAYDCRRRARLVRILSAAGWILAVLEIYKQLFLYYIVNGGCYDWWYFPFQLCSVPMYLCIALPAISRRSAETIGSGSGGSPGGAAGNVRSWLYDAIMTFLACYTFVSAVSALVYPEDFLRSYISLTAHGFIWHGILLYISLTVVFSGSADLTRRGFGRATLLFLALCPVAIFINAAAEPLASASPAVNSYAAMFYLNPYHISPQPVIDTIQRAAGIPAGLAVYITIIILISGAICALFAALKSSGHHDR